MLAVNSYDAFLKLVQVIIDGYTANREQYSMDKPGIMVLVGPTGSGKTHVARKILERNPRFEKLVSYTTSHDVAASDRVWYHHVPMEEFRALEQSGEMFESTMYAHHGYGSRKSDVQRILDSGKHVLTVMDICGAMAMKAHFDNVVTVYLKREKRDLLTAIVEREIPVADKVNRLLAVEAESRNEQVCDYVVEYTGEDETVDQIFHSLHID